MYDTSVLWQSQALPGVLIVAGFFWLFMTTYVTVKPGGQKRGFVIVAVIVAIVAALLFGVMQEVRYIRNPSIKEKLFSYTSARTSVFDFGDVYVFTDENGMEYDLTIYPKTAREYLNGESPRHGEQYQVYYEPETMTVVGIHSVNSSSEERPKTIQRITVSKEEFQSEQHLFSLWKIYKWFVGLIVACIVGLVIAIIIFISAEALPTKLLVAGVILAVLVFFGPRLANYTNDVLNPDLVWEEMYFEDFNYNAGTDHLFYTTVEYDFTSEDGERYYIDYHEGKLEEYLNVREMQPGGKYMLLYDVKSGQVLDVKTLE